MNPDEIIEMIKGMTLEYGVNVTWQSNAVKTNSRGIKIEETNGEIKSAKVLLLKEKFDPLKPIDSGVFGLTQEYARFIIVLPDVEIMKDLIITDNHNKKWKLGIVDWFDIAGKEIMKQSALTEVN